MSAGAVMSYQRADELDEAVAAALLRWGLSLADTKHRIGIRTSEWVNGGPALEAAVGASAITQDELGHARSLYAMLKEFPGAPEGIGAENDLEARDDYFCPRLLNEPWPSWLDVIAVNVLLDRATALTIAAARESAFGPLKGRTAKILQEESFHRVFGDSWLGRLARMDQGMHGRMQAALNQFWPTAMTWFGPDEDETANLLLQAGILATGPSALRALWQGEVAPLLERHGYAVPETTLDWSGWHPAYRDSL